MKYIRITSDRASSICQTSKYQYTKWKENNLPWLLVKSLSASQYSDRMETDANSKVRKLLSVYRYARPEPTIINAQSTLSNLSWFHKIIDSRFIATFEYHHRVAFALNRNGVVLRGNSVCEVRLRHLASVVRDKSNMAARLSRRHEMYIRIKLAGNFSANQKSPYGIVCISYEDVWSVIKNVCE